MIDTIHLIITSILVGIIWIIQRVHYPAFRYISSELSDKFHTMHTRDITPVVAPLMVAELCIVSYDVYSALTTTSLIHLALVIITWGSTFGIQVPLHQKLSSTYSLDKVEKLVRTNWVRTVAWTAKLASMIYHL